MDILEREFTISYQFYRRMGHLTVLSLEMEFDLFTEVEYSPRNNTLKKTLVYSYLEYKYE